MDFLTLIFVFGVVGITHIIVDGDIFQPVRDFWDKIMPEYIAKLIHCYMCAGFWVGIFAYWLLFYSQSVGDYFWNAF